MKLKERIAVVTGATRGIGKGVALALAAEGATVYITGRTAAERDERGQPLPGSLESTITAAESLGGKIVGVRCDHGDDAAVAELMHQVDREAGRLDILVNNVFAVPDGDIWSAPFWEQPIAHWDLMHRIGLRSHYVASSLAAPIMIRHGAGLIANISSWGGKGFQLNVAYGVGKAGVDRLARDMARDLRPHQIAAVSLYPGIVRTERIVKYQDSLPFDMSLSESPEFTGRAVAALAADPERMSKTGKVLVVAELAAEYGFTDVDGTTPRSLAERSA